MRTIGYKVSYEKMISRIPGLFAYLESEGNDEMILHSAADSINGCYGKIVANIKLPLGMGLSVKDEEGNIINVLNENETYTFRTLITNYYKYKDNLDDNNKFKNFIEQGIGKITIDNSKRFYFAYINIKNPNDIKSQEEYNTLEEKDKAFYKKKRMEYVAMPNVVFLSNVKKLYNDIVKMAKQCEFYEMHKDDFGSDSHLCCLCERYQKMGGEVLKEILSELIPEATRIAAEYLEYARNGEEEKPMSLDFDIDLVDSYKDLGIMTPYIPQWIPYKTYYQGERVLYEDIVFVCKEENNGKFDEDYQTVVFDESKWEEATSAFEYFDSNAVPQTAKGKTIEIKGSTDSKLKSLKRSKTYIAGDDTSSTPDEGYDWLFYYRTGLIYNITTLKDEIGNIIDLKTLEAGEDPNNLAAYGDVIEHIYFNYTNGEEIITMEKYNTLSEKEKQEYYLNNTLTFVYRTGVHLIGVKHSTYQDDDKNIYHSWKDFVYDDTEAYCKEGIKYEETYNYVEEEDLDKLVRGTFVLKDKDGNEIEVKDEDGNVVDKKDYFKRYTKGDLDTNFKYYKFEFITYNNYLHYQKTIANQTANIVTIQTDFTMYNSNNNEFMEVTSLNLTEEEKKKGFNNLGIPMFRKEYLNGITYSQSKNKDVNIERGTYSVFDKHIRFSEVKTLEDMEDFQNSSFFSLTEQ